MDRIGIRQLRQHASQYLARVTNGEILEITDRGRPVARIVPVTNDQWTDLVSAGRVIAAQDPADIADEQPRNYQVDASGTLAAMRASER
jgi:prevent-host-death family protein